jgi:hypothetical protein
MPIVGRQAVTDAYRAGVGALPANARSGPAGCSAGQADERAWSRPAEPTVAVGRFRCVVAEGRAEMWWTDEVRGLVAHARAFDGDLAHLFAWWEARTEH